MEEEQEARNPRKRLLELEGENNALRQQLAEAEAAVAARERAEGALRDSEERFRAFSESTTEGIVLHERGVIIEVNSTLADHLGYTREEMLGRSVLEFTAPESHQEMILRMQTGDPGPYLAFSLHKDGSRTIGEIRARETTYKDRPTRVVAMRDITEFHELQQQQKILLQTVSHDLRVPLSVIKGHAQVMAALLEEKQIDGMLRQSILAIDRGVHRIDVMIQDLVDATRWEGGRLELKREAIALPHYLDDLLRRIGAVMETSRIRVEVAADLPAVHADHARLERILVNLLSNSLKYSDPGTPVLVRARLAGQEVEVSVSDQGRGIAPADLPHLFERFFRAAGAHTAEGLGLGLYITRALVEAHGGRVWAKSELGKGSTFYFTLPTMQVEGHQS